MSGWNQYLAQKPPNILTKARSHWEIEGNSDRKKKKKKKYLVVNLMAQISECGNFIRGIGGGADEKEAIRVVQKFLQNWEAGMAARATCKNLEWAFRFDLNWVRIQMILFKIGFEEVIEIPIKNSLIRSSFNFKKGMQYYCFCLFLDTWMNVLTKPFMLQNYANWKRKMRFLAD